jgi:D-3-phosphoglycerate dehydrogenase
MRPTILVTESSNFSEAAARRLIESGQTIFADLDRPRLLKASATADVLWVRLRHRIDREVMDASPRLKVIASPTTGLNHIDLREAELRGIRVISLRGETEFLDQIFATAEHTLALTFGLLRRVPAASAHAAEGGWNRDLFRGRELHGKTAGIIGYGRVGRMVAGYLQALGMAVLAADSDPGRSFANPQIKIVSLADLLDRADLVSLHVSFTEANAGFFGQKEFERMKPGSWFINTSRGELVDEAALLQALEGGGIAGAALDVLSDERSSGMSGNALVEYARSHDNLLITPHIAGCTLESMQKTEDFLADKLAAFLDSQVEVTCVEARNAGDAR